jgi:hypothetical protein
MPMRAMLILFATAVIKLRGSSEAFVMDARRSLRGLPSLHADPAPISEIYHAPPLGAQPARAAPGGQG